MKHTPANINKGLWLGLLGERLDAVTVGFGLAVIATVFIGKKMPANAGAAHQQPSKV